MGTAIAIGNTLEVLGEAVAAHSVPLETVGSGNTIQIEIQYASADASSSANNAGVASFSSIDFNVDSNGFVTFNGSAAIESFMVDAFSLPGSNPVLPNNFGIVTVTGGQVAAGTTSNVIQTNSLATHTYTIQVQRSQAVAVSTIGDNGVSHFNSTYFTVDANGFVSVNGGHIGETITGNTGGALSPTAGNWNILGSSVAAGTTPIQTSGSGSTLTIQVQTAQAIASTNASNIGLAAFNSTFFTVDANGFVSVSGTGLGQTITGNSGGALSPTAGNWNILGTGSITTVGSGSTLTVELTGLTAHAILVGAGTTTITKVGPTATSGQILQSQGSSSDPAFSTATYPSITTINQILYSSSANVVGGITAGANGVLISSNTNVPSWLANSGTPGFVLTANSGAPPSWQSISADGAITTIDGDSGSATPSAGVVTITGGTTGLTTSGSSATLTLTGTLVVANGGTGSASFNTTGVVISGSTSTTALTAVTLTDGQLAIGSSVGNPAAATLTAGTGITITNGHHSITVATSGNFLDQIAIQVFTGNGTYTPTSGMKYCIIEVVGGGGGAGNGSTSAGQVQASGGGGAGGYSRGVFSAATVGSSQTVTVAAGVSNNTNGNSTSVGALLSATGGTKGTAGSASTTSSLGAGGAGGTGSSGSVNITGGQGGHGIGLFVTAIGLGGAGGSSIYGNGGVGAVVTTIGSAQNQNATAGSGYGGGGGGGTSLAGNPGGTGGGGAAGIVIITEYLSV